MDSFLTLASGVDTLNEPLPLQSATACTMTPPAPPGERKKIICIGEKTNSASMALSALKTSGIADEEVQPPTTTTTTTTTTTHDQSKEILVDLYGTMTRRKQVQQVKEKKVRERVKHWNFDAVEEEWQRQHAIFRHQYSSTSMKTVDTESRDAETSEEEAGRRRAEPGAGAEAGREIGKQIRDKVQGYRYQDQHKGLYRADAFVTVDEVVDLLRSSGLRCYYCRRPVLLLYRYVRDGQQWSLERLDNSKGHDRANVVVACLQCNLHRKTANSDSFVFSKQLSVVIKK